MKYIKILSILFFLSIPLFLFGCKKVPAGNVGVKVYLLGSSKGVESEELGVGRYWIGINEELFLFPTFTQNYTWTKENTEGSPNDESITFQTVEGLTVSADIGISYRINPDKVTEVFQKYRRGVEEITDVFLRNMVRDSLVTLASNKPIESVYGEGKTELIDGAEESVSRQVEDIGIIIEKIYWVGQLRLPKSVILSINSKIEATQIASQRRNEVEQSKAEADKKIEEARGTSESLLAIAKAEAESIKIQGDALRQNPAVLKLRALEKWDGVLPKITGNSPIPFVDVTADSN